MEVWEEANEHCCDTMGVRGRDAYYELFFSSVSALDWGFLWRGVCNSVSSI